MALLKLLRFGALKSTNAFEQAPVYGALAALSDAKTALNPYETNMYENFYGLRGAPFSLLPDAEFLYPSKRHKRAMNSLEYGISSQAGFMVITGEVGSGKTTLIRRYLKNVGPDVTVGVITNSSIAPGKLLHWVASAFNLDTQHDAIQQYDQFVDFLLAQYGKGKRTVLIVDEAQNLGPEMLEELRMLSNVNNEKDQLLQIILVGQPELLETLQRPDLRQFVQRIVVHCHLDPLLPVETAAYIRHRLNVVGGSPNIFDDMSCAAVHHFAGGVPRLINLLCDQAMMYAYSDDLATVSYQTVMDVVADRKQSGLSAFKDIPESWAIVSPPFELKVLVHEITKGP
jgi:type II secretory pathway predicted ATPase ExeA